MCSSSMGRPPPGQESACRHRPSEAGTARRPHPLAHWRAVADRGPQRQPRGHQPTRGPSATRTDWPRGGIAGRGLAAGLRQDAPLAVPRGHEGLTMRRVAVRRGVVPGTHHAPRVPDDAARASPHPARRALPLPAALGRAALPPARGVPPATGRSTPGASCRAGPHGSAPAPGETPAERRASARGSRRRAQRLGGPTAAPASRRHGETVGPQEVATPPASLGPPRRTVRAYNRGESEDGLLAVEGCAAST